MKEIPYSSWLTYVARWHIYDLQNNKPNRGSCNVHSWSNMGNRSDFFAENGFRWTPCCKKDGAARGCSWDKPREISNGAYKGVGFEIACSIEDGEMTNYEALECWKGSPPHLDMMLNRGIWADNRWKAIGAAISYDYALVWFSEERDTSSE